MQTERHPASSKIEIRDVPDFALLDQHGRSISLHETLEAFPGGVLLLFIASDFLPADRDALQTYAAALPDFQARQAGVLALSGLNWEKLHKLARRTGVGGEPLPFPLLFDACCRQANRFGMMLVPKFLNARATLYIRPNRQIAWSTRTLLSPKASLDRLSPLPTGSAGNEGL